jgi:tryptophanyl-tRNA synthetase
MRVLSGIQPTGRFHWGNYFGAIQQYIALQNNEQSFYFIADLHALTSVRDRKQLEDNVWDAAVDLLALGLNPDQAALFRQSDVPEVTELMWLLMTVTQFSLLEKCHSYKDKVAKGIAADAGLFTYPVLMAADILLYDSDIVPVGADQIQHLEVTRDIAQRFNSIFGGEFLHLPNARVLEEGARVPGTDGEKMSKSYGNTLEIFEAEKPLRKKIMSIKTDSTPMEAPKNPDTCSIYTLFKFVLDTRATSGTGRPLSRGWHGLRRSEAGSVRGRDELLRRCACQASGTRGEPRLCRRGTAGRGEKGSRQGTASPATRPGSVWSERSSSLVRVALPCRVNTWVRPARWTQKLSGCVLNAVLSHGPFMAEHAVSACLTTNCWPVRPVHCVRPSLM